MEKTRSNKLFPERSTYNRELGLNAALVPLAFRLGKLAKFAIIYMRFMAPFRGKPSLPRYAEPMSSVASHAYSFIPR